MVNLKSTIVMGNMTLFELNAEMAAIEETLIENGGELTPELEQALAENEKSLAKKVDDYAAIIAKFSYTEDVLDAEIKRLQQRKKVVGNAKERLKKHVCDTMGIFGLTKLESNLNTFTRRSSTRLETNDEKLMAAYAKKLKDFNDSLPAYLSVEMKVNKNEIKNLKKASNVLPEGATLIENFTLQIK